MWSIRGVSSSFLFIAFLCLFFADIDVISTDPWGELGKIGLGFVSPSVFSWSTLFISLANTVAFALLGVGLASILGLLLASLFHWRIVRLFCAFIRAIHELFWALLFLQLFGLHTLTGLLAIVIPFTGIFTKVYAEILEECDQRPLNALSYQSKTSNSGYLYARLAVAWPQIVMYTRYRLECGIRSSSVLGFVGLPTLGFHLESYLREGHYSHAAGVLYMFFLLIATLKFWSHRRSLLLLAAASVIWLPFDIELNLSLIYQFLSTDIWPPALRDVGSFFQLDAWSTTVDWSLKLFEEQAIAGIWNTLLLTMLALVGSGLLALMLYPLISPLFFSLSARAPSYLFLVVLRSIPELMLAFIVIVIIGPSMLPAIIALSLHNGAIIAHLIGQSTQQIKLRPDAPKGINLYSYEVTPRIYRPFLAFLFYRWEVILRESAILGILGIHTLGFFIDSAFEELRFDRALFLILITAGLNILVDVSSRHIRKKLRLTALPEIR